MKRYALIFGIAALLILPLHSRAGPGAVYHLAFRSLHIVPGERVSKFDLHIQLAMVVGFLSIPVGWEINIDNDPSWVTHVSGIAVVGSSWLEPIELRPWFLSLLPEPADKGTQREPIKITGSLVLSRGDNNRVIEIRNRDIVLMRSPLDGGPR